jgi:hypothetical protein
MFLPPAPPPPPRSAAAAAAAATTAAAGVRAQRVMPQPLMRTHTSVVRQNEMIEAAEVRIMAARAEWRAREKKDAELAKKAAKQARKKQKKSPG